VEDVKGLLQSKTVWGVIVMVLATLTPRLGLDIGDQTGLVADITALIGAILAIYGRIKAVKKVGGVVK